MSEKIKIILFEDNQEVSLNIIEILELNDYAVYHLEPDVNLRESLSRINPDLILSDIMMPKKSGFEVLRDLREIKEFLDIPFIFLTAKTTYDDLRNGMNIGADDYIFKPFSAKDLLRSIELRLEKANSLKEKINEFSNNVAIHVPHEMRTPLVSLLGYSSLILDDYKTLTDEDVISFTERINYSAKRLHRTIEKFIQYSNLVLLELDKDDRNKFMFGNEDLEVSEIINSTIHKLNKIYMRESDLQLNVEKFLSKLSEVAITTILYELFDNAFKFSNAGSPIIINGFISGGKYLIEVIDHGKGIHEKDLRILNTTDTLGKRKQNGFDHGFGLAIINKMVHYLQSELKIDSKIDNYTKVQITII